MKILISSYRFSPDVGGIESCSAALAAEFRRAGHQVTILTRSLATQATDDLGFQVERRPSLFRILHLLRTHDVFWQNNVSLVTLLLAYILGVPAFVTTATWLTDAAGRTRPVDVLKRFFLRRCVNLYISQSIAEHIGWRGIPVANPYDSEVFRDYSDVNRDRDLVFLGRLVSDKGCDLLLDALCKLRDQHGTTPTLTIIGSGPEQATLERKVDQHNLAQQVAFAGVLRGEALARELNRHRILVVPSRWNEPFGIVALEGIACGNVCVVSSGGGLPEATGACGVTFKNGDSHALAGCLEQLLTDPSHIAALRARAEEHLRAHRSEIIAQRYLDIFAHTLG